MTSHAALFARRWLMAGAAILTVPIGLSGSVFAARPDHQDAGQPVSDAQRAAGIEQYVGLWQAKIAGAPFKLRNDYNVEIKVARSRNGEMIAVMNYFIGKDYRPTTICRSQLVPTAIGDGRTIFNESLNFRRGKDDCPIWKQVAFASAADGLDLQWLDGNSRKSKVRMAARAQRAGASGECRLVADEGSSAGLKVCRTPEGDWVVQPG